MLNFAIEEKGGNLSSGEKQLICIVRAALRKSKIVILDEATAAIDLVTESRINSLLANYFRDCTMITIAHRLQTIMNCDRILVLDSGKLIEIGEPAKLLSDKSSSFAQYVAKAKSE